MPSTGRCRARLRARATSRGPGGMPLRGAGSGAAGLPPRVSPVLFFSSVKIVVPPQVGNSAWRRKGEIFPGRNLRGCLCPTFRPARSEGTAPSCCAFLNLLTILVLRFGDLPGRAGPSGSGARCGPSARSAPWGNFQSLLKIALQRVARCGGREITALDRFLRNAEGSLSSLLCPPGKQNKTKRRKEKFKITKRKEKKSMKF